MRASISPEQIRALGLLAGAGAENASTAIALLTGRPIAPHRSQVKFLEIHAASELMHAIILETRPATVDPPGRAGRSRHDPGALTGIAFDVSGSIVGSILVVFTLTQATDLLHRLETARGHKTAGGDDNSSGMSKSALEETGNIVAGAFLSAIAALIGGPMANTIPRLVGRLDSETLDPLLAAPSLPRHGYAVFEAALIVRASPPVGLVVFLPQATGLGSRLDTLQTA